MVNTPILIMAHGAHMTLEQMENMGAQNVRYFDDRKDTFFVATFPYPSVASRFWHTPGLAFRHMDF